MQSFHLFLFGILLGLLAGYNLGRWAAGRRVGQERVRTDRAVDLLLIKAGAAPISDVPEEEPEEGLDAGEAFVDEVGSDEAGR